MLLTSASYSFAPSLYKDLAYDAVKDFKPITNFAQAPLVLAVPPSMPVLNVKELLDLARKRPGEIHYASAGRGSNLHLTTELFKYMAKINLVQVPYKGGGPAGVALTSGEVQVSFLKSPETVKQLASQGSVAVGNTPEEFAFVRAEIVEWGQADQGNGIMMQQRRPLLARGAN